MIKTSGTCTEGAALLRVQGMAGARQEPSLLLLTSLASMPWKMAYQ